jgi:hypothetical protein
MRTGRENSEQTKPRNPTDFTQSLDAGKSEAANGGNGDENRGAGAVHRKRVQTN